MTTNETAFSQAKSVIPGGVDSPVRAFGGVGGTPRFIASASGARVTDVEGRSYVDLVGSWGPALLGHAHPEVVAAVQEAASRGLSFGAPTETETLLAAAVRERVPFAQRVRFVSTGTEATMTAIRLARGATGRDLIVKFAGNYHGHSDVLLAAAGSGVATGGLPGSAGVPEAITAQTIVLPYNDVDALRACFEQAGESIAAVIFEGAPANMGTVPPHPGWNREIRRLCTAHGALMILDEVLTGFRVDPAGWWGLEAVAGWVDGAPAGGYGAGFVDASSVERADWVPDLVTFGKVVGGGMPLAAVAGRADVMDLLAPLGPVYQAGTLSGNPLATAAGLRTLELADQSVYDRVNASAQEISMIVSDALSARGPCSPSCLARPRLPRACTTTTRRAPRRRGVTLPSSTPSCPRAWPCHPRCTRCGSCPALTGRRSWRPSPLQLRPPRRLPLRLSPSSQPRRGVCAVDGRGGGNPVGVPPPRARANVS